LVAFLVISEHPRAALEHIFQGRES
jgi:hypothetical protein